ncbi:MAG: prepilin-type N-terminal cleavage/methylation domain-containing protein [Dissulfurispiraceae bacterium]|jgi:prepilin-type N-terminal cleavage/methylation domain-containing protein|nr:prepilin-type N-terminal cleavage/methylation domain-containing protein [Dissulfurispiraceae bacterium]
MKKNGFTLLEVIIAVAILGVVAVVVSMSLRLGVRAWERGGQEADIYQRERAISERLGQQIKSAFPYYRQVNAKKVVAFEGAADSLWFVTMLSNPFETGFRWVSYYAKDELLVTGSGIVPDKKIAEKVFENGEVLDSKIKKVKFEYYSAIDDKWEETWILKQKLPAAVRIAFNNRAPFIIAIPAGETNERNK